MPDRSERRAVFEAGSAFIENDRAFAGPADVVEKAGALVRQGLTPSTWHYPDPLLLLTLFCVVYLVVSVVVAHASGRPDLPLPLSIIGAGAAPVFLALRLIFPPNIRIPLDDASFEKSAARHRAGLILAPLLGAILPLAPIVTSPN
jgi:hypothetical protein